LWFWDQPVHDYIGEHLHLIDPDKLSSRTYVKAVERKAKGDWQEFIARRYFTQTGEQWLLVLESDPKYTSVDERVAEFTRRTGLSRSTYFNLKRTLKADGQLGLHNVPRFTLAGRPPEVPDLEAEARAAAEQERNRTEQERFEQQQEDDYRDLEERYFDDEDSDDDG
jgi:hypothetical protein